MTEHALRPFKVYSLTVFVSGTIMLLISWASSPPPLTAALLLLAAAALLAEGAAVLLPKGFSASLSFPLSLAANLLLGPSSAGVIGIIAGASPADVRERVGIYVIGFNTGQTLIATLVSGWLYLWAGGRVLWSVDAGFTPLNESDFTSILIPLLVLGLSATAFNLLLVGLGHALKYGVAFRSIWAGELGSLLPIQGSLSVVAISIAQVMAIQTAGLLLFVFPLLVSRQVHERYVALRQAYIDTVRSLVAALEAKDRYTAGHSERVASYAVNTARAMNLPVETIERIDLAAQLHDLGKVGIPNEVLAKPGRLTSEEFEMIRGHPEVGADIVEKVPALEHIVPIVRHHHERYDGQGYCAGLAGEQIPLEARIMAVADSFDAMTSSRAYRSAMSMEAAVDELQNCSGTQFDAEVVVHFLVQLRLAEEDVQR